MTIFDYRQLTTSLFTHYYYYSYTTQVNYQYRTGVSFPTALKTLYADGGIPRFYRGVLPAMLQGPLSRFGDTAANTGVLTLMDNVEATKNLNVGFKTVAASAAAAIFRIFLMPIDTVKVRIYNSSRFCRQFFVSSSSSSHLLLSLILLFILLLLLLLLSADHHASYRKILFGR
jgi:hypothetical protein